MASQYTMKQYKRHLSTARREIGNAVERWYNLDDPRKGHTDEAMRMILEVRHTANRAVKLIRELDD